MNLALFNRDVLAQHPALLNELDQLIARINIVWGKEHDPQTGVHTDITADSLTVLAAAVGEVSIEGLTWAGTTQTTVGGAGGASALPATPLGYVNVTIGTTAAVIPYYLPS